MSKLTTIALTSLMVLGCSTLPSNDPPTAEPVQSSQVCPPVGPTDKLVSCFGDHFSEHPLHGALLSTGNFVMFLVNSDTLTWTVLEVTPQGVARVVGTGTHWMSMKPADSTSTGFTPIHEWYEGIKLWRPGMASPLDCCGERDCAPYPHRSTPGELAYEALINGAWVPLPPDKVVGEYSPDDQVHVCCVGGCENTVGNPSIRCVILPGRGA